MHIPYLKTMSPKMMSIVSFSALPTVVYLAFLLLLSLFVALLMASPLENLFSLFGSLFFSASFLFTMASPLVAVGLAIHLYLQIKFIRADSVELKHQVVLGFLFPMPLFALMSFISMIVFLVAG
jgi:hypothetical protein